MMMRRTYPFSRGWLFAPRERTAAAPDSEFQRVSLPHTNVVLPWHSFDNREYQFISTYRKRFTLPEPPNGRRLVVQFDGAMTVSTVFLNGVKLGEHAGGYTPFQFNITDSVRNGENVLEVSLDSSERPDVPPNGYVVDYLTFGGIYREAFLHYLPAVHIADVFVRPSGLLTGSPSADFEVTLKNADTTRSVWVGLTVEEAGKPVAGTVFEVVAGSGQETVTKMHLDLPGNLRLWSPEDPYRYGIATTLYADASLGEVLDDNGAFPYGFREAAFEANGLRLNGHLMKLRGLNRHQSYPYIGYGAPARLQRKDADILKVELGVNIVRTSHYPQSPHFLDRCDEIGLLVFEEIPGWQFIGDEDWQALSLENVQRMILRDRNHPSIILWGVRINESPDDEAFYQRTNALAHQLDPTRPTGGVRNFLESQFLEDVFTYNDFSNTVVEPTQQPHLVTEHNGHMFPAKSYDNEERQVEHALRHARVMNKAYERPNVVGAIGWCAFDYNTHREFGAGDRICYHGVSDIFRLPKFAAYLYESQIEPSVRPVLRAGSFWAFGEVSETGVEPLLVFSNCEKVRVRKGGSLVGVFEPDRERFPSLPHPPFTVMGLGPFVVFGAGYEDLRLEGLIAGEVVVTQDLSADGLSHALTMQADDAELVADGADMTRVVFRIVDRFGNRLPYATAAVAFEIEGPGKLIGENPFALVGGQAAVYVAASETPGTVTFTARAPRLPEARVVITVLPDERASV
ncbi:MAG: glycoside hydrolase family 2 TIM barrel-domain containing protein [Anaerolineae bacterium]